MHSACRLAAYSFISASSGSIEKRDSAINPFPIPKRKRHACSMFSSAVGKPSSSPCSIS